MKSYGNNLRAGSGVVILLVSFVLGVPCATQGHDSKASGTRVGVVPKFSARLPVTGTLLARAWLEPSFVSRAESPNSPEDLSIDASLGDAQVLLKRKHRRPGGHYIVIQIIAVLIARTVGEPGGHQMIDLDAAITGADAVPASLLYALAWLAGDTDPLRSVRALGYNIDVTKEHDRPCTGELPSQMCVDHARELATLLDATLALGSVDERLQFRQGASALGVAPDCIVRETASSAAALAPGDLSIEASLGDRQIVLEKGGKGNHGYYVIKLKDLIVTRQSGGPPETIDLRARITGVDRAPGSLLYALAWLAGDTDPLGSVCALGYDINVSKEHDRPCTGELASEMCVDHARRLATLLDATLALGSPQERLQFRQGAAMLGVPPDCSQQSPVTQEASTSSKRQSSTLVNR
jgi:hypothetical protein